MNGFPTYLEDTIMVDASGIDGDNQYIANYNHFLYYLPTSSFVSNAFYYWLIGTVDTGDDNNVNISTVHVLRFLLFISVSLFLYTAVLLQGTLLEIGMVRCRRTLERWNRILSFSCRRLTWCVRRSDVPESWRQIIANPSEPGTARKNPTSRRNHHNATAIQLPVVMRSMC